MILLLTESRSTSTESCLGVVLSSVATLLAGAEEARSYSTYNDEWHDDRRNAEKAWSHKQS